MTKERRCESLQSGLEGSVVSYPKRCELWGDSKYRGNCDGTLVKDLILQYGARSVADPMFGSNTTGDVCEWLNQHGAGIEYWGDDLRAGFDAVSEPLPYGFDLVWVHPPYHSMIRYTDDPRDLSNCATYEEFVRKLRAALENCASSLKDGGRLAVLVGDLRKNGAYTPIVRDVLNMEGALGKLRSILIKAQHNVRSGGRTYSGLRDPRILHEYCVLFEKDAKAHGLHS